MYILYILQDNWKDCKSRPVLFVLIQSTNEVMKRAAMSTNKTIDLGKTVTVTAKKTPKIIGTSSRILRSQYSKMVYFRDTINYIKERECFLNLKSKHRQLVRQTEETVNETKDRKLYTLVSGDPMSILNQISKIIC